MTQIKELTQHIKCEMQRGHDYIMQALQYKDKDRDLSAEYAELAQERINDAARLHKAAVKLIKMQPSEPPPAMLAVWEYLHAEHIEAEAEVRRLLAMYRD